MLRSRRRQALARATALALLGGLLVAQGGPASADTVAQAQAQAHQAALEVQRLQPQIQSALADYQRALTELGSSVSTGISRQQWAAQVQTVADQAYAVRVSRIRALYIAGGGPGLASTVLAATSPQDLVERVGNLQRVLAGDRVAADQAQASADAARVAAAASLHRSDLAVATESTVSAALARLLGLEAAAQARLDTLSAQAKALADAQAAQASLVSARAAESKAGQAAASTASGRGIPADFLALYKAAAPTCPGLDWHILGAIGQVESGHGRSNGPSPGGAEGPMQFLPHTFAAYAVDGNHDGVLDIWNPADAIFTAAHYLCANGAGDPNRLYSAIWNYNHADWYVQMVLKVASDLRRLYPS